MSRTTLIILTVLALAFAALTGLAVKQGILGPPRPEITTGGAFDLRDQSGRATDQRILKGKWSALFFGFTYCPEACPTTLLALGEAEKLLGDTARDFQTVFISVDPERDTPKVLANYLSNSAFPRTVIGLTGTPAQVEAAARAYHVFYQKAGDGPNYQINHSTITYLMGPRGNLVCYVEYGLKPEELAAKIKAVMSAGPGATSC